MKNIICMIKGHDVIRNPTDKPEDGWVDRHCARCKEEVQLRW